MIKKGLVRLTVQIQPNASQNQMVSLADGVLKVRIAAPPVEGRANQKLIAFLSDVLDIPKSDLTVASGLTNKRKTLVISSLTAEQLKERLGRLVK